MFIIAEKGQMSPPTLIGRVMIPCLCEIEMYIIQEENS